MDRRQWKMYQTWKGVRAALPLSGRKDQPDYEDYVARQVRATAEREIRDIRRSMKPGFIAPLHRERNMITGNLVAYAKRPKTKFRVVIGPECYGEREYDITRLFVGHMWQRTVGQLYLNEDFTNTVGDWLILKADRMKVNVKHIALYECIAFNLQAKETRPYYVTQVLWGEGKERKFFGNVSRNAALQNAQSHLQQLFNKRLEGAESND